MADESPIKYDEFLKLTIGKDKEKDLEKAIRHIEAAVSTNTQQNDRLYEQIENVPHFPSVFELAKFASLTYKSIEEQAMGLENGWTLLTVAKNDTLFNGYRGSAFYHAEHRYVVIAHHGTVLNTWQDSMQNVLITDGCGVEFNRNVPQIRSATTFVHLILEILSKIERAHFDVFITGHSLGGWLAQITTYTSMFLQLDDGKFKKCFTADRNHVSTVVFDSPGCRNTLLFIHGMKYSQVESCIGSLDITTYISGPSKINSVNEHVGVIYEITKELNDHGIKFIIEELQRQNCPSKMLKVVDWPKYVSIFESDELCFAQEARRQREETSKIRYKTERVGVNECSVNVFTGRERKFLIIYKMLLDFPNFLLPIFYEVFSSAPRHHVDIIKQTLDSYDIHYDLFNLYSTSLDHFIPFLRRIDRLYPKFFAATSIAIKPNEIIKSFYCKQSTDYILSQIENFKLKFNAADRSATISMFDGHSFSIMPTRNAQLKISKIYHNLPDEYKTSDHLTILKLNQLSCIHEAVSVCDFLSIMQEHLLIVDCHSDRRSDASNENNMLNEIKNFIGDGKWDKIKIIFVTILDCNTCIENILAKTFPQIHKFDVNDSFEWIDLCEDSQAKILATEVNFQGDEIVTIERLIGPNNTAIIGKVLDCEVIISLICNESIDEMCPSVGTNVYHSNDFGTRVCKICEEMPMNYILKLLDSKKNLLFVSGSSIENLKDGLDAAQHSKINKKFVKFSETLNLAEEFDTFCCNNSDKIIYWLDRPTKKIIFCRQVYSRDFYLDREFTYRKDVWLSTRAIRTELMENDLLNEKYMVLNVESLEMLERLLEFKTTSEKEIFAKHIANNKIKFLNEITEENYNNEIENANDEYIIRFIALQEDEFWTRFVGPYTKRNADSEKNGILKEDDFYNFNERIVIIADEPGMGKSTTLTSVATKLKSSWILRLNLKDCSHYLATIHSSQLDVDKIVEFLTKTQPKLFRTPLSVNLFKLALLENSSKRVYIMFDGFDEINEEEIRMNNKNIRGQNIVIELIRFLNKKTKAFIVITTRKHTRKMLVNDLSESTPLAIKFKKIENDAQVTFLMNFWKTLLPLRTDEYGAREIEWTKSYTEKLLASAPKIFAADISNFIGIPLQLRMLAEVFVPKSDQCHHRIGNLSDIFFEYVKRKIEIYLIEKVRRKATVGFMDLLYDQFGRQHEYFSLELLFPSQIKFFPNSGEITCKRELRLHELYRVGIIKFASIEGRYEFIHRTLAEYFTARFFYDLIMHVEMIEPNQEFMKFIEDEIFDQDRTFLIRKFLNCQFSNISTAAAKKISNAWNLNLSFRWGIGSLLGRFAEENLPNLIIAFVMMRPDLPMILNRRLNLNGDTVLHVAAENGSLETVECLLKIGANIRVLNNFGQTALHSASEKGKFEAIVFLIKNGAKINALSNCGNTVLHYAAEKSEPKTVTFLIENGAKIHTLNGSGETALHFAARNNNFEVVELLVRSGADVNALNDVGDSALHHAAQKGHTATVEYLMKNGARDISNKIGETVLHRAAQWANYYLIDFLIANGSNIHAVNVNGDTALHLAYSHTKVVERLMENGANIHALNGKGYSALHLAFNARCHNSDTLECLVKYGAGIQDINLKGKYPMHSVAGDGYLKKAECLLRIGADINFVNEKGETALHACIQYYDLHKFINFLIENGADIGALDENGDTALHLAAAGGRIKSVRCLIAYGANIHALNKNGDTPLHSAAESGCLKTVELLMENGANIHTLNEKGETALHSAARDGDSEIMERLINNHADINAVNHEGENAFHLAAENGNLEIIKILLKIGVDVNLPSKNVETSLHLAVRGNKRPNYSNKFKSVHHFV